MLRYLKAHPEIYDQLEARAAALAPPCPPGVTVNRVGSMFTLLLHRSAGDRLRIGQALRHPRFGRFFRAMLERGIYLAPSQFEAAFLSAAHTEEDIRTTVEAAGEAFGE